MRPEMQRVTQIGVWEEGGPGRGAAVRGAALPPCGAARRLQRRPGSSSRSGWASHLPATRVLSNLNSNPRLQCVTVSQPCTDWAARAVLPEESSRCWIFPRKWRTTPFSSNVCLRALASRTLTFGTGSDARLRRLGSKCSTNWSTGMHSSSTTAYKKNTTEKARLTLKLHYLPFLSTLSLICPVKKSS